MLKNNIIPQIKSIFVGRHSELQELENLWKFACQDGEHFVHVFLNAPGVGKTTLINQFGNWLENNNQGLFLRFNCSSNYDSLNRINKDLINLIEAKIFNNQRLIENYINQIPEEDKRKWASSKYLQFKNEINDNSLKKNPTLNDVHDLFVGLSKIIPIFFAADEIQEFQKISFNQNDLEGQSVVQETALHYFTRILKDVINLRVFAVLSGTRYHILSQIGEKIGSPIRQKVKPLVISNFTLEDITAYVERVKTIIRDSKEISPEKMVDVDVTNYARFLKAFSGGHPRTIENITEMFLKNLPIIDNDANLQSFEGFMEFMLPKLTEVYGTQLLSSDQKEALSGLKSSEEYALVKEWLVMNGSKGLLLGKRPTASGTLNDEELTRIIFDLMNIGIIVQNGSNNYYLTSYFHFTEFLKVYHEPHEEFLKQVLHNKYFKLMCGSHSGLGYTFENVLAASLLIKGRDVSELPIKVSKLRDIDELKGMVNWSELVVEPNVLYQTPSAKAIDGFILQDDELFLLQITTALHPDLAKLTALIEQVEALKSIKLKIKGVNKIHGWFISLYSLKSRPSHLENLILTDGEALSTILTEEIYSRLIQVKESFSS